MRKPDSQLTDFSLFQCIDVALNQYCVEDPQVSVQRQFWRPSPLLQVQCTMFLCFSITTLTFTNAPESSYDKSGNYEATFPRLPMTVNFYGQ